LWNEFEIFKYIMEPLTKKKIVVIGGGFGGVSLIKNLSKLDVDITLIDKKNYHLFQPLLYQVAGSVLSPSDIAVPLRWIFRKQKNTKIYLDEVIKIDRVNRKVECKNKIWEYDYLVLSAGLTNNYFGNNKWAKHTTALKTLDDALIIRNKILNTFEEAEWLKSESELEKKMKFVIIGGGATGVELAGVLSEIANSILSKDFKNINTNNTKIILIEGSNRILSSFHEKISSIAEKSLKEIGVQVIKNEFVKDIKKNKVIMENSTIETENIFWTAGVKGSDIVDSLECNKDSNGRVFVEEDCSIAIDKNMFVIGDLANYRHESKSLPGVAQVAIQMGKHVSRQIKGDLKNLDRKSFKYIDLGEMATIGKSRAVVDVMGFRFGGFSAWLIWLFVHLIAIVSFRNRLIIGIQWCWSYISFQRHSRIIR
jgi:NADH dehydrogenase